VVGSHARGPMRGEDRLSDLYAMARNEREAKGAEICCTGYRASCGDARELRAKVESTLRSSNWES
jgi:hypothetical protein